MSKGQWYFKIVVLLLMSVHFINGPVFASGDNNSSPTTAESPAPDKQQTNTENTAAADSKITEFLKETSAPNDDSGYSAVTESDISGLTREEDAEAETTSQASLAASSSSEGGGVTNGNENMLAEDLSSNQVQVSTGGNTGAAVTSIPIAVPPGRKGIQPNISLNYNSNRRNGWLGVGWNLDMGSIQRNTKRGVIYTNDDYVASVNGAISELTPRGDWGANRYGAKIEGAFTKYYHISDRTGWIVTTKDGTKYFYGYRFDGSSRQDNYDPDTGQYRVFKWCLDRVEDTDGNYMDIYYRKDQGEIYLDEIKYTGNVVGLPPTNSIKFLPDSNPRTDIPSMYTINSEVKTKERLGKIEVYGNGQLARRYALYYNYSASSGRSLLIAMNLYDNDGMQFLSVHLDQGRTGSSFNPWYASGGDFGENSGWTDSNTYPRYMADVNGDGKADIVGFASIGVYVSLYDDCGSFSSATQWVAGYGTDSGWSDSNTYPRYMADVNGDGKADIVGFASIGVYVSLSTGGSFTAPVQWVAGYGTNNGWTDNNTYPRYMADVNGDGMADVVGFYSNGVYVSLSTGSSFTTDRLWVTGFGTSSSWTDNDTYPRYMADVNGDGKADVVGFASNGVYVSLSTGSSFTYNRLWVSGFGQSDNWYFNFMTPRYLADVNGDGRDDIIGIKNKSGVYVSLSQGDLFTAPIRWGDSYTFSSQSAPHYIKDINGDGMADIIAFGKYGSNISIRATSVPLDLLRQVTNFTGGTTTIQYKPSSKYSNNYLPFIVQTVSSVEVHNENNVCGTWSVTTYDYSGGYYDVIDREFRGFSNVTKTEPNLSYTETDYYTDHLYNYYKGLPKEQTISDSSGNIYTRSIYTYDVDTPYTGVHFPYLTRKDDYIFDGLTTDKYATSSARHIAMEVQYDIYGNITSKYFHGDENISGDEKYEYTYYAPYNTAKWILSLPKSSHIVDGKGQIMAQKWFSYYPNSTNLYTVEAWNDNGPNPVTTYEGYDPYGNPKIIRDPRGNLTKITYDTTSNTYPWKVENASGHFIEKTYDYRFGKVLTEKDQNQNQTTYEYDGVGRIKRIIKPVPYGITEYFYNYFGNPYSQHIREEARDQAGALMHWRETYLDGQGRTIKEMSGGPGAASVVVRTEHDVQGLIFQRTYPYYSGDTVYKITYWYDPVNRLEQTDYPDGTSTFIDYDRGSISYTDANGHLKIAEKDAYGRIVAIEEYTGSGTPEPYALYAETFYWYDALNNLEYVRDAQGNETYLTYDSLSRKRSIYDPDMGLWEYEYDANGNLISQTDQMDRTIHFEYDELNRVTLKNYPSGTDITYVYDEVTSTNSKGRMTRVTDSSGATVFNYDAQGQITRSDKTLSIDSSTYTTQTQYDPLGRVKKIIYPDNTEVDYSYDDFGNIYQIKSGAVPYVTYNSYNALGDPLLITYNNGITTQYQYYPENKRLKKIYTKNGTTDLMNLEYFYDNIGNITYLTDHLDSNKTRSYKYDDLDRLIESDSPSYGGKLLYQYDKIGNMTYNCKFGHYYYEDANHVHAVTSVRKSDGTLAAEYQYDGNGNMIYSHDYGTNISRNFTYDYDNMPTSITANSGAAIFMYDAFGMRVAKTALMAGTTKYIGQIYECNTMTGCTKYIFTGMQRMAEIDSTGTHYYHTDHLGSSTVMTDQSGAKAQDIHYYPYGEILSNSISNVTDYLYTGKEWDAESGLYYYGARYYDPKLARFISADTIVPEPFYPQSLNRYSYAVNNPIVLKDLDGHCYSGMPSGYSPPNPTPGAPSPSTGGPGGSKNTPPNIGGQGPAWGYGYNINPDGTYPISPHSAFYAQMSGDPSPGRSWSSYYGGFWGGLSEGAKYAYNEHIAPAMQSLGTILSTDLKAFYRGQVIGHLKVLNQDIKDIGAAISNGDIKGIVTKALETVVHLAFPYYGNNVGLGYGDKSSIPYNDFDGDAYVHDNEYLHLNFVRNAYSRNPNLTPTGPIGMTYTIIGTIPFLTGGILQMMGLMP